MRNQILLWTAVLAVIGWMSYGIWRGEAASALERDGIRAVSAPEESAGDSGGQEQKLMTLTFDDGPHPVYTPELLDGLKERNVRASFFLLGSSVDGNEDLVERMAGEGHLIGNHTLSHVRLTKIPLEEAEREIAETNEKILAASGVLPVYIRPPYGEWNEELEGVTDMEPVFWNVDPLDWKVLDRKKIADHIVKNAGDGRIVLLHDSYETTVDAALEVIDTLKEQGYTFVTVDELLVD